MNYASFCEHFTRLLSEHASPGTRLLREKVRKNNDVRLDALIVTDPNMTGAPVIYLAPLYEYYTQGTTMDALCNTVLSGLKSELPVPENLITSLCDFETVRDRLVFRLISRERNQNFLKTVPWVPFLDLAVVFALHLGNRENQQISSVVHNQQAAFWGLSPDELYSVAKENSPRLNPAVLSDLEELLFGRLCASARDKRELSGQIFSPDREDPLFTPIYVLTNESGIYGASCMLYDNIIKDLADRTGSDLIILPSSIHEVLIIPAFSLSREACSRMIRDVNREEVPKEDILSDEPYLFSRSDRRGIIRWKSSCADKPETDGTENP